VVAQDDQDHGPYLHLVRCDTTRPTKEEVAVDTWEYSFVDISALGKDIDRLNRLGAEGWEAVGMVSTWGAKEWRFVHPVVLMKRPLVPSS
jgi:hypothetical protein